MFQSLTGSIHTDIKMRGFAVKQMFQSLTGSIHTFYHLNFCFTLHRFNPSQVQFTLNVNGNKQNVNSKFQSLTGSIHTGLYALFTSKSELFQSLTGSIHTAERQASELENRSFNPSQVQFTQEEFSESLWRKIKFQSLTGSIHTLKKKQVEIYFKNVSIPHRFNSHHFVLNHLHI